MVFGGKGGSAASRQFGRSLALLSLTASLGSGLTS